MRRAGDHGGVTEVTTDECDVGYAMRPNRAGGRRCRACLTPFVTPSILGGMRTVLTNCRLAGVDESGDGQRSVVVDGDLIESVAVGAADVGPEDVVHDLDGRWVAQGFTCAHGHADYRGVDLVQLGRRETDKDALRSIGVDSMRDLLHSGFTGYVGAGTSNDNDAWLNAAIEAGEIEGPRVVVGSVHGSFGAGPEQAAPVVDGLITRGAQIIKLFATNGHGAPRGHKPLIGRAELEAVVAAAHARGVRVRAHTVDHDNILDAIEAGVDVIDHGEELDDRGLEMMAERGTYWVPSAHYLSVVANSTTDLVPDYEIETAKHHLDSLAELVQRADDLGVRILLGDDFGLRIMPHGLGEYAHELESYVALGFSPATVLRWAGANGASVLGLPGGAGGLAAGAPADLVVVNGNPAENISLLTDPLANIPLVMKAGTIYKNELRTADELALSR